MAAWGRPRRRPACRRPGRPFPRLPLLRRMPAAVTEVALSRPRRACAARRRVERLLHAGRPRRIAPVEVARVIGAGRHAVAAAQAALRHLADDARGRIHFHRVAAGRHRHAGRLFFALLAHHRDEGGVRPHAVSGPRASGVMPVRSVAPAPPAGRCFPPRRRPCRRRSRCSGRYRPSCRNVHGRSYGHHLCARGVTAHVLNAGRRAHLNCAHGNRRVHRHFYCALAEARLQNRTFPIAHMGGSGIGRAECDPVGRQAQVRFLIELGTMSGDPAGVQGCAMATSGRSLADSVARGSER